MYHTVSYRAYPITHYTAYINKEILAHECITVKYYEKLVYLIMLRKFFVILGQFVVFCKLLVWAFGKFMHACIHFILILHACCVYVHTYTSMRCAYVTLQFIKFKHKQNIKKNSLKILISCNPIVNPKFRKYMRCMYSISSHECL